jgi:hypothetical protein
MQWPVEYLWYTWGEILSRSSSSFQKRDIYALNVGWLVYLRSRFRPRLREPKIPLRLPLSSLSRIESRLWAAILLNASSGLSPCSATGAEPKYDPTPLPRDPLPLPRLYSAGKKLERGLRTWPPSDEGNATAPNSLE